MGGRCAEKIIFNNMTTGAGNDISVATDISKKMVCEWGMSEKIGPISLGKKDEEVFLGKEISKSRDFSEEKSTLIDNEITDLVKTAEINATNILNDNIKNLHDVSNLLMDKETIDRIEFEEVIKNGLPDTEIKTTKRIRRRKNETVEK